MNRSVNSWTRAIEPHRGLCVSVAVFFRKCKMYDGDWQCQIQDSRNSTIYASNVITFNVMRTLFIHIKFPCEPLLRCCVFSSSFLPLYLIPKIHFNSANFCNYNEAIVLCVIINIIIIIIIINLLSHSLCYSLLHLVRRNKITQIVFEIVVRAIAIAIAYRSSKCASKWEHLLSG